MTNQILADNKDYKMVSQIGEGGYASAFLVDEISSNA